MSSHLTNDDEYRRLLEERAKIDARLATFQSPTSAPSASHQVRRRSVPQSSTHSGQSINQTVSSGRNHHEAIPMSASVSQRSASMLASTAMQCGSSSGSSMSFSKSGRVPPPIQTSNSRRDITVMDSWATGQDDPVTAYTFQPRQPIHSLSQRRPDLEQVEEIDSGELPEEYFTRTGSMPILSVTPSSIEIPTGGQWRSSNHRDSTSSRRRSSFGITTPSTPSSAALTSGTTYASEMSRQNSICNDAILGSLEMMNVHSNTSIFTDISSTDERAYQSSIPYSKISSEEQSLLLAGTGGVGEDSQFSQSFQDFRAQEVHVPSLPSFMGNMKRSPSNESNSSSISTTSRAATQLKRQNQLASSRPLAPAPKFGGDEIAMSREGSHAMVSMKSKDGLENRAVAAIAKAPYQRPKHDRVFCKHCNDYPEGFRGQHELGRHYDRQHKKQVKKWVCVEPNDGIINPSYQPVNSLSKCKACSQQRKKYGAYYNAAAHLRRAHFNPKQRGRTKSSKVDEKLEKRGGTGGGHWPPMSELKRWMKDVYENAAESQEQDSDEEEEEDMEDDECGENFEVDDNYPKLHDASNISNMNSDYDSTYIFDDTSMLDVSLATTNFNTQSMPSMSYENLAITQSIDNSMHIDSSPSSFADSQFASMNDQITFIEPFHQTFADQIIGPVSFHNFQYQM